MKIVSVSHYYTPHVGGLEIVAENQVISLIKNGHQVTVVTCAGLGEKPGTEVSNGATVYRAKVINVFDRLFAIPFPVVGIRFLKQLLLSIRKSDAVHVHDVFYMTTWFALLFAYIFSKPLILTQHVAMVPHPSRLVMLVQKVVYAIFGRLTFSYSTKIVVYNPQVRDFLSTYNVPLSKILFIHNGIETSKFKTSPDFDKEKCRRDFGLPLNRKLVLFVGRLVPKKGYDLLFDARHESFDLVYVGSGQVPSEWLSEQHFHFLGSRSQAELSLLYQAVDLFVFPAEGEMFTLVMQEAMASGLPIIATDEPGYKEYELDRKSLVLCERSSKAFNLNIRRALADKELLESMSTYSLHLSKTYFDWDNNFASVLEIYNELSNQQTAPKK
jgi:D-inositol-3-phosphate glycosyltransferase